MEMLPPAVADEIRRAERAINSGNGAVALVTPRRASRCRDCGRKIPAGEACLETLYDFCGGGLAGDPYTGTFVRIHVEPCRKGEQTPPARVRTPPPLDRIFGELGSLEEAVNVEASRIQGEREAAWEVIKAFQVDAETRTRDVSIREAIARDRLAVCVAALRSKLELGA